MHVSCTCANRYYLAAVIWPLTIISSCMDQQVISIHVLLFSDYSTPDLFMCLTVSKMHPNDVLLAYGTAVIK